MDLWLHSSGLIKCIVSVSHFGDKLIAFERKARVTAFQAQVSALKFIPLNFFNKGLQLVLV